MMSNRWYIFAGALVGLTLSCSDDKNNPVDPVQPVLPSVTINDHAVIEGTTALVTITLDKAAESAVIYQFTTANITAQAGSDYTAAGGTDTIGIGSDESFILVGTIDDSDIESAEQFSVVLTSVSGATVSRSVAVCTINDNDNALVSFAGQVRPLLQASCASVACHGGSFPGGGMYIGTGVAYADVIAATGINTASLPGSADGKVVQPGDAANSTLFTKVDTVGGPPFPSLMPSGGRPPLSLQQQTTIKNWINQGAQDN
jgi:hypothetical protein